MTHERTPGVAFRVYAVPGHTNDERAAPVVSGAAQLIVVLESTPGAR